MELRLDGLPIDQLLMPGLSFYGLKPQVPSVRSNFRWVGTSMPGAKIDYHYSFAVDAITNQDVVGVRVAMHSSFLVQVFKRID